MRDRFAWRSARPGDGLDEAFFEDPTPRRARGWVLPLSPVALLWAIVWLVQHAHSGLGLPLGEEMGRALAGVHREAVGEPIGLSGAHAARRLRFAHALLARGEAERARGILRDIRMEHGEHPLVLRALARAERAVGHREQAAELYVVLLQNREDDIEALEFFLSYRYEDDDLHGALELAEELRGLGALEGEAALLANQVRAELAARAVARRLAEVGPPRE